MLNPKSLKDVSNHLSGISATNDDKIGNIFLNMDTFKYKLNYSISEIETLKTNTENCKNIIGVHNNRIELIETNLLAEHNYNISHNDSIDILVGKTNSIDQEYNIFKNNISEFIQCQNTYNIEHKIGIDIIKGDLDNTSNSVNTFTFEVERLTTKIDDFYNSLPKFSDIQSTIDNHPIIKSFTSENDSIYLFKELHTNYDIYVKNKCLSDFIENSLDKRDLNLIKRDINSKLDNVYHQLNTKIDNRIKIYAKNIEDNLIDEHSILYGNSILLHSENSKLEFKCSNSMSNSIVSTSSGLIFNIGNNYFTMMNNGNMGINIEKPKYTVDTNGSINTKLGFYEDGCKLVSSQWKVNYGQLVYRDTPIGINELHVENGIFINKPNSSILCTNHLGEITSKTSLSIKEIDQLDSTIIKLQEDIEKVEENSCFNNGIHIGENISMVNDTLTVQHDKNKIVTLNSSGDIYLHKYTNAQNQLLTISNGKIQSKPQLITFIVNMMPNKKYTIKNNNSIQLQDYQLENGQVYIHDKIKINEGIIFISSSTKKDNGNFHILQNNRIINGGFIQQTIKYVVINRYGSLAITNNGDLLYKLSHQFQWGKVDTFVFTDIIDIETDNIYFYVISKANGVFQSNDFKNWVSIKELLDTHISYIKLVDTIMFAVGYLKFNNELTIYKKDEYWKKTYILDGNYMITSDKNTIIRANNSYLIGMSNGFIYILDNNTDTWATYAKIQLNNRILSMAYFNNQYFIYAENIGILITEDLFNFKDTNYFKTHINKIYSNFIIQNDTLYISNLNNLYQMSNNNLWLETTFDKLQNISILSTYKYISNCSILDNKSIDLFPNAIFLMFDNVILRSNDIGVNWVVEDIENLPSNLEKVIIDDIHNITIFKDFDLEFNKDTSILKVLYKDTTTINTVTQFDNDYGKITHLLYRSKIIFDNDFDITTTSAQTVQYIFKCL